MSLRAEKDHLLAREKEKLTREYEHRLAMERAILHDRLQKELQFRMRQDLTTASSKNKAYGGLLNPPRFGGDHAPKTEAYMKARNEFKCVSEDTSKLFQSCLTVPCTVARTRPDILENSPNDSTWLCGYKGLGSS